MFYQKDMCMIYNMKLGRLYNRWMGTVNVPNESSKCVVMSTVTADVLRTKEVHWDVFVKRVLELPKTNTLVNVEGIGVDKACLYIIHEHLTCETLFVRLNVHQNMGVPNTAFIPMFGSEVIAHMLEILEGMELLHSFGFVHPGLSTKKVLVTNQGNCKLYDFCLCEDACNVVRMKSQIVQTPRTGNHFAPEVILRNEYTKASDLWSTAVVLWELMSGNGIMAQSPIIT
ncbi:Serine/threonine-protein kinase ste20 [Holothuria leucospilota]|uniref:Serine/threonine-protein kinase ste20 n=1 Tax=Holothuria leucospilota TaxID=206669 RepID=A0A9Q1C883_HOLLE|nr:Serine/threonine-protein kinase ste20 [Holothuria leucospilota]